MISIIIKRNSEEGRVNSSYIQPEGNQVSNLEAGTETESMEKATYWLSPPGLFSSLSYVTQDYPSTTHSGLSRTCFRNKFQVVIKTFLTEFRVEATPKVLKPLGLEP